MKKLVSVIAILASMNSFAASAQNDAYELYNSEEELSVSQENLEEIKSFGAGQPKYMRGWECESRAVDGAMGLGRGYSRFEAAQVSLNYCRAYSINPYSCRVMSCFPL